MGCTFNTKFANLALVLPAMLFVCFTRAYAVEPALPSSVEIYWKSTRTIAVPGISSVVVLDDEIAQAQLGNDTIEFVGLTRGDTVALAYVNGAPVSIVVHVIERPIKVIPPSLLQRQAELAHGSIGSDVQMSNSAGQTNFVFVDSMAWSQQMGDSHFSASSQFEDNNQFGGHTVNLRTGNVSYFTPGFSLNLIDFTQSLTGEMGDDRINNFSSPSSAGLRGVGLSFNQGKDVFSFYAATTIPYYFLSLNATRDVAGFTFHRRQTDRLSLFGGSTYVDTPLTLTNGFQRHSYFVQTGGASYRLTRNFTVGAQGGYSNAGGLLRADLSYASYRFSGYGTVISAAQTYPLNQLQSLFSGTSQVKSGFTYKLTSRLNQGLFYEHTDIAPGLIYRYSGSSDYLSPNLSFLLARGETLSFDYTYSRSSGGFVASESTGNRYDVSLSSSFSQHIYNSAQVSVGSIQDPLQINSQDQFTLRDSLSLPVKGQTLLLTVEHDSVQPSLISKLNQEIALLSPVLQAEFLANPQAFVDSSNFPPEIKALLEAEQPTGTTFGASSILSIGSKLRLTPSVSVTHVANGPQANSWTQTFGYSLVYQLRPSFQFHSSLSNVFLFDSALNSAVRTTVLGVGFEKTFTAVPGGLPFAHRSRIIEGRVFRDNNINGAYNVGEPGLEGVEVRLEDGQVAITDPQGRYKFNSVSADQHQVSIALTQFRHPVRMTTPGEAQADLIQQRIVVANFGILDFARLMGSVYNDLRFDNRRQPDSKGMQDVELVLDDGKEIRKIQTDGSGEFQLDDVPPGDYKLSLDTASMPPNYQAPAESFTAHVSPVSTVVQDIPVRALRSISGRVLLKSSNNPKSDSGNSTGTKQSRGKTGYPAAQAPLGGNGNQEFALLPVGGVEIIAGPATATTDNDGNFLLRNLPAGDLKVTIRPVRSVPEGINIPSGQVKLPAEPVQIQGATIVITNADLLPYLTREFLPVPGMNQEAKVATGNARQPAIDQRSKPQVAASNLPPVSAPPIRADATQPAQSESAETQAPSTAVSAAPAISAQIHPAADLAKVPSVAPAAPIATATANNSAQSQPAVESTLTRAACQAFQSLGESAQCFRQLKAMTTASPR
jgi:hypothetical protein